MDFDLIREGVTMLLTGLGGDLSDPNFRETPNRVVEAYREICGGLLDTEAKIDALLSKTFPCQHQQMIIAQNVEVFGICPHHLLPVHYLVDVAYMPGENGQVVGLSKLPRIVETLARRPVLQEQMINDITAALNRIPGCLGAACVARGEHFCIRMRGIRQNSTILTSSVTGIFKDDAVVRSEFFSLTAAR